MTRAELRQIPAGGADRRHAGELYGKEDCG